jgi:chromosome partitioning protein
MPSFDNRSERLKRALRRIKGKYDYIIVDNPPSLGLLAINAFVASHRILIPVSTGFFALTGLVQLQETIDMVKQTDLNPDLEILGVLCTFSERTNVSRDVEKQLRDTFGELVFDTAIPQNGDLTRLQSQNKMYTLIPMYRIGPQGEESDGEDTRSNRSQGDVQHDC